MIISKRNKFYSQNGTNFNKLLRDKVVPESFKRGVITPVLKKGKDPKIMENYRGITVTSTFGKVFEYALISKLCYYQSDLQFGFTEKHSPIAASLLISEAKAEAQCCGDGLLMATLDSQKAFDVVHHSILLNMLASQGADGTLWLIIKELYNNITSKVKWAGVLSESFPIKQGVRQGDQGELEALTACLGEIDDECGITNEDKKDECSMEEITAFLEASDDEEGDAKDEPSDTESTAQDQTESNSNRKLCDEDENEFSDMDEMDMNEISSLEQSQNNPNCSQPLNKDAVKDESQANATVNTDKANIAEDRDDLQEASEVDAEEMIDSVELGDEGCTSEEGSTEINDCVKEDADSYVDSNEEGESEANLSAHDAIKAEMAAMAERMKQLQEMLANNSPKTKEQKDNLKKKEKVINNQDSKHGPSLSSHKKSKPFQSKENLNKASSNLENSLTKIKDVKDGSHITREASIKTAYVERASLLSNKKTFVASPKPSLMSPAPRQPQKRPKNDEDEHNPFFGESVSEGSGVKVDSRTVFGDSDDSDWEDLGGEEKSKLSDQGKELKKLINSGAKKREAHTPKYDATILKKPNVSTWAGVSTKPVSTTSSYPKFEVEKPKLNPETGTVSGKYRVRDEYRPKVDVPMVQDNREFVQDPYCGIRIVNPRISMDSFRSKMEGRAMIKISRLLSKYGVSDLQKDNWVTLGVVVHKTEPRQSANGKTYCIWKLSDLTNCDETVTFFLFSNVYKEHWKNETGVVIGLLNPSVMDKAEKAQSELALTIKHPQQLLILGISKDLGRCKGTTKAGNVCSNFINKTQGEFCTYHVQTAYRKTSSKRTELQTNTGQAPKAFEQKRRAGPNSSAGCFFYGGQTFTTMSPRTTNTKDKVTLKKLQVMEAGKESGKLTTMSLHELKPEDTQRLQKIREKDKQLLELLSVPTVGAMNFVKHLVKKDTVEKEEEFEGPQVPSMSAKDLLKQHQTTMKQRLQAKKSKVDPLTAVPKLGKGFEMGQEISLDVPIKKKSGSSASAELAKQLAIAKVKSKGGICKEDPNAVRKKLTSPENKDKIRKRVADDMDKSSDDKESVIEPPKKKSKLLGNLDLNSEEVQKLLKCKSKHTGALAEAEAEHEERYFSSLEKKEQMEAKMDSIMEVQVTLFSCKQCNYRYFSLHDRCKQENHSVKKISGTKRFFKCKQCKKRCISLDKMPTKPCKECGSSSFDRVSMLKERSGPKLESEELSLRGNEQKYVGSIQGKSYLNVS